MQIKHVFVLRISTYVNELERIQTQMTQKLMLRSKLYTHAMRAARAGNINGMPTSIKKNCIISYVAQVVPFAAIITRIII